MLAIKQPSGTWTIGHSWSPLSTALGHGQCHGKAQAAVATRDQGQLSREVPGERSWAALCQGEVAVGSLILGHV